MIHWIKSYSRIWWNINNSWYGTQTFETDCNALRKHENFLYTLKGCMKMSGFGVILSQTSIFNSVPTSVCVAYPSDDALLQTNLQEHALTQWIEKKKKGQAPSYIFLQSVALLFFQLASAHQNCVISLYILLKILMLILTHETQKKVFKDHRVQKARTVLCNFSAYADYM